MRKTQVVSLARAARVLRAEALACSTWFEAEVMDKAAGVIERALAVVERDQLVPQSKK